MFFSVIIPIYNNSQYIERGFKCLKEQTFKDFEVIMIDDSSTDSSGEICYKIAQDNSFVKVIHQPNTGAGGARNAGINAAKGDYLAFFDIDDLVDANWLENLHNYLIEYRPQMAMWGYIEINPKLGLKNIYKFDFALYNSNEAFKRDYVQKYSGIRFNNGFVWNKAFERKFISDNKIRFENLRIQQDEVFNLAVYPLVQHVLVLSDVFYTYYVYYKGNTASNYIPGRLEIYRRVKDSFLEMQKKWSLDNLELEKYIYTRFYNSLLHDLRFNLFHPDNSLTSEERREHLRNVMNDKEIKLIIKWLKGNNAVPCSFLAKSYYRALESSDLKLFQSTYHTERIINKGKSIIRKFLKKHV